MNRFVDCIYIKNYRGFKEEQIMELSENGHITFLIGCNNTGKSLITRLLSMLPKELKKNNKCYEIMEINDTDFHMFNTGEDIELKFIINKSCIMNSVDIFGNRDEYATWINKFDKIVLNIYFSKTEDSFKMELAISEDIQTTKYDNLLTSKYEIDANDLISISEILYSEIVKNILVFDSIRSFDRIGYKNRISGNEIIEWLIDNKDYAKKQTSKQDVLTWIRDKFNLDVPLSVEPSIDRKELNFVFDGQLKLNSSEVGTGYTMLYILLMEISRNSKKIIVIDEIESHLQPGIIRALMDIIQEQSNTQFIISTHAPTVISSSRENDYLYKFIKTKSECKFEGFFRNNNDGSKSAKILREVYNDLGVLPANVLLSNCIIWVEGPSEIFWIRAWLREYLHFIKENGTNLTLVEGLHYSILMTGGSNISHLSFEEGEKNIDSIEEEEMLRVLRVNPNPFVIIDSDNMKVGSEKYNRTVRIGKEINSQNRLNSKMYIDERFKDKIFHNDNDVATNLNDIPNFWIMEGKELENYCHPDIIKQFYTRRCSAPASKITGVDTCINWDVFSTTQGTGRILTDRGVTNIEKPSGTIKHKDELARFVYNNLKVDHFRDDVDGMEKVNADMLKDLKSNLHKLIKYITYINNI